MVFGLRSSFQRCATFIRSVITLIAFYWGLRVFKAAWIFFFFPFLYPCSPDAVFIIIIRSSILSFLPWCLFTFILSLICLISLLFLLIVNSKHLLFSMKWSRLLSLTRISLSRSNFVLLGTLLGSQLAQASISLDIDNQGARAQLSSSNTADRRRFTQKCRPNRSDRNATILHWLQTRWCPW